MQQILEQQNKSLNEKIKELKKNQKILNDANDLLVLQEQQILEQQEELECNILSSKTNSLQAQESDFPIVPYYAQEVLPSLLAVKR